MAAADGAGVEHVDARVRAGVESADDQIGRRLQELEQGELDAIGRPAFDRPAHRRLIFVEHFLRDERREQRDRVTDGALLARRRDHRDRAELLQLFAHGAQAGSVNAVVVCQQDAHRISSAVFLPFSNARKITSRFGCNHSP